jgi:hypothetical protein
MRRAVGCEGYAQLYGMGDGCVVGCVPILRSEHAGTTEGRAHAGLDRERCCLLRVGRATNSGACHV